MKLLVKKAFKDKYTGELYPAGTELDVSAERGAEILEHPMHLAEEVKKHSRPTKQDLVDEVATTKTNPEIADFLGKEPPSKTKKKAAKKAAKKD